ncbi:MAG: C45 family peptidase [Bryobacteraceae bacterium]
MKRRTFLGAAVCAAATTGRPAEYPIYRARGSHRELGRQHGEQAAAKIAAHLDYMAATSKMTRAEIRKRALRFEPLFARWCPHLLEEIRGLGEGAGLPLADALAVNIRGELAHAKQEGCTAYAVKQGEILIGQNSDITPEIPGFAYVLHLKPEGKPEVLTWTFGGMIGYHGINSAGIGHFANALGGGPGGRFGMPHYPVKRMMLECRTSGEAVDLLRTIPLASNGNYVMCDAKGILDVEATTAGPEVLGDEGKGYIAHTNHFVCSRYARKENFAKSWKDSFPRLDRMKGLLAARKGAERVEDLGKMLSDHEGHPVSICRHDKESCTVASIIAEPAQHRMHVAVANPCENRYATYSM